MNERIKKLAKQAGFGLRRDGEIYTSRLEHLPITEDLAKFAELIVAKVLDEVAERAYISGDRAWSDDLDRHWVELEFGFGRLAKMKNERTTQ